MNTSLYAELLHSARYPELLDEANTRRLRESVAAQGPSFAQRIGGRIGRALVQTGSRLQAFGGDNIATAAR
jgi:hypothetical protein